LRNGIGTHGKQGQSMVELALTLPLLVVLFVGLVEVAFIARTYLVLLEASREGARLGARGSANFDDSEIGTLTEQDLSREGYTTARGLQDIIIVRADIGPGKKINSYAWVSTFNSGLTPLLTQDALRSRLAADDPQSRLIAVEIYYDHRPLIGFPLLSDLFPRPFPLHAYSIMRLLQ
jgi:Flp pilus assembly protein TadG